MDHLESFIAECDRRTELAKKRLAETQEEISAEVSAKVGLGGPCPGDLLAGITVLGKLGCRGPPHGSSPSAGVCVWAGRRAALVLAGVVVGSP